MRVYDTPSHWHHEPDIDPFKEEELVELHGENWKEVLADREEEYEFYNFEDEKHINIEGLNL
jgi:hypothetical protein